MNIREKIILGLMIIVVLYGAFEMLNSLFSTRVEDSSDRAVQEKPEYIRTAENIRQSIQKNKLNQKESYIMDQIRKSWTEDIFYTRYVSNPSEVQQAQKKRHKQIQKWKENFDYNGYVNMGDKIFAVINGIEYAVGDKLENSNFKLIQADPDRVLLQKGDTKISISRSEFEY